MSAPSASPRIGRVRYFEDLRIQIHDGDAICESIFHQGAWEEDLSERLIRIASQGGGTLVDVGANVGYFSLLWAKGAPHNEAFAFEASPRILPELIANVRLNGLLGQIHCLGVAAGDRQGISEFVLGPEEQTGWGGLMDAPQEPHCKVATMRLDAVLPPRPVRLLKIDVEGADTLVLKGCEGLLRAGLVEEIFFEQNAPRMAQIGVAEGEAQRYLRALGFGVEPISATDAPVVEWHAVRQAA